MATGNWGQQTQSAAELFGSTYLRDYAHASKIFRSDSYANAPKYKFLFHVYFNINPAAWTLAGQQNVGILVKDIKLPTYNFRIDTKNQYNRKRVIQTKITYEPIQATFHDDNNNSINKMWYAYYTYYYNDTNKVNVRTAGRRGSAPERNSVSNTTGSTMADYNVRNIYDDSLLGNDNWGYIGEAFQQNGNGKKVPFFKNITVYGFNQRNFTAYTLINPIITNFVHDTYNYGEGAGIMQNTMTIDYETVTYDEGAIDGNNPSNFVPGFGNEATYDLTDSPINGINSRNTILGQGGLTNADGGYVRSFRSGNEKQISESSVQNNTYKNTNQTNSQQLVLSQDLINVNRSATNSVRNITVDTPIKSATPSLTGIANSKTVGVSNPNSLGEQPAGAQISGPLV
jgi:hypothetical protein